MGKPPSDKNGLKKGPWTPEEDQKLIDYIQKHGQGKWRTLPKNAGLRRCGKSCRLRWTNYLRPDIKRGSFSLDEEQAIIQLHSLLGNKWSTIAARLPGRTDNEIKNYWNTHIKKKLLKMGIDPVTHAPRLDLLQLSSILSSSLNSSPQPSYPADSFGVGNVINQNLLSLVAALLSSQYRNPDSTVVQSLQDQVSNVLFSSQHVQLNTTQASHTDEPQVLNDQANQLFGKTSTTSSSCRPQFEMPKLEQFSPAMANLISSQNNLPNLWQYGESQSDEQSASTTNNAYDSTAKLDSFIELLRSQILQPNHDTDSYPSCSFDNLLSSTTSSSCPTPLNSTSTVSYAHCNVEDDRDTHCSNRLMYNIHNTFKDSRIM